MLYNGKYYLKYRPHIPVVIELEGDIQLAVSVKHDVALVEIPAEIAGSVLPKLRQKMCGCCGDEKKCFAEPSGGEIQRWLSA